jgi:hypothetical protein
MFNYTPIEFDDLQTVTLDGKRFYLTPDGNRYPSVTTVTGLYGKQAILEWRQRVGEAEANRISTQASSRGTRMHTLCEKYLLGEDFGKVMPDALAMFNKIKPILDENITDIYGIETPLYSDHLRVAGRVDCIARFAGKRAIVDFKTSSKPKKEEWITNYFMQCAAYAVMFEERTGISIPKLAVVIAVADNEPQLFVKNRDDYIGMFLDLREEYDAMIA